MHQKMLNVKSTQILDLVLAGEACLNWFNQQIWISMKTRI